MKRALVAIGVVVVMAAGCATRGHVRDIRADVEALRSELTLLRQAHDEHARETSRALADLKSIDTRVREIGTGLGETTQAVGRLGHNVGEIQDELKQVRARLAERPVQAAAPPPREERPPRDVPSARQPAADAAYAHALATFRGREHGQAVLEFLDFLAKYPRHPLAANAQYWIGEAYYMQRDYRQAIAEFVKVLDLASPNGKAADALLKIGLCYASLREPSRAHQAWERVINEHPHTDAAVKARSFLRARRTTR